jgi:predicted aspartyl protease
MPAHKIRLEIIELEKKNYHIFIQASVDGQPARFLLDTGASRTVLDATQVLRFVKADKIMLHESKSVGLGVTEMETKAAKLRNLKMGKARVKKMEVAVLDISHVNTTYDLIGIPRIDGVLGSDFLMKYEAVINYAKATLKLSLPSR